MKFDLLNNASVRFEQVSDDDIHAGLKDHVLLAFYVGDTQIHAMYIPEAETVFWTEALHCDELLECVNGLSATIIADLISTATTYVGENFLNEALHIEKMGMEYTAPGLGFKPPSFTEGDMHSIYRTLADTSLTFFEDAYQPKPSATERDAMIDKIAKYHRQRVKDMSQAASSSSQIDIKPDDAAVLDAFDYGSSRRPDRF